MRPPRFAVALAVLAALFFALPLAGLMWRIPWSDAWGHLRRGGATEALGLSLLTTSVTTVLSITFGIPLAWLLARGTFPGRSALRALCTLSMVLPPVVGGVALLSALGRSGMVGRWFDRWLGISLPFTTAGVVVAQTFVAMPFLVVTVEAALRQAGTADEDASRTLGASPWTTFRRVTLPGVAPAVVAGAVLTWARALGEFGATIAFAGNLPGRTQTMPLAVYLALERDPASAFALSGVMVAIAFAALVGLRDRWLGIPRRAAVGGGR